MPTVSTTERLEWYIPVENWTNGIPDTTTYLGASVLTYGNTVTRDGPVSDFRGKIRRLESASSSLSGLKTAFHSPGYVYGLTEHVRLSDGQKIRSRLSGELGARLTRPQPATISLAGANNIAIQKFVALATRELQACESLVSFGEIGELARMIRRPSAALFQDLYNYLGLLRKRTRKVYSPKEVRRILSESWLEWAFGWSPVVSDINNTAKALSRVLTYTPPHKVVSASGAESRLVAQVDWTDVASNWTLKRVFEWRESASVRYHGCVATRPLTFSGSLSQFGISLNSLIPSIYELIPHSFLVDYFSNIGNVISGVTFNSAALNWCEKGTRTRTDYKVLFRSLSRQPLAGYSQVSQSTSNSGDAGASCSSVSRVRFQGPYIPSLDFRIPGLGLKWLNISALILASKHTSKALSRTKF